ncbi:zinc-binding alcohol dehydrogenase family protein [Dactylosporangium sp. CA-092794]|uniref:zinc-binding alcohol dehydrogenase family protein n=1 Tax=Dactylosporangium sp. CA-092794 TaxID=3239929 RepID=UPI003D8E938D
MNRAAWIDRPRAQLSVRDAPRTEPGAGQVEVRVRAIAINPVDWIVQLAGSLAYRWLKYPAVIGCDIAGEVVTAGPGVTRFRPGDRVLAHVVGTDRDSNTPAEGAFQLYSVALERMTAPIPDDLPFEDAAVLPLAVSTASCGLFQTDYLGLRHPAAHPAPTGETLLVWGGATSVGSQAIQLAVAAGYEVVTTASPHNHGYVRGLGAKEVFDYTSATVVDDIVAAFAGRRFAGAIAFGQSSGDACVRIAARCEGRRFVALGSPAVSFAPLGEPGHGRFAVYGIARRLVAAGIGLRRRARRLGVRVKDIYGTTLKSNEVSTAVYRDFLPAALAAGSYSAVPAPRVAGTGLEHIQEAMELQRRGVSAAKIVVRL